MKIKATLNLIVFAIYTAMLIGVDFFAAYDWTDWMTILRLAVKLMVIGFSVFAVACSLRILRKSEEPNLRTVVNLQFLAAIIALAVMAARAYMFLDPVDPTGSPFGSFTQPSVIINSIAGSFAPLISAATGASLLLYILQKRKAPEV